MKFNKKFNTLFVSAAIFLSGSFGALADELLMDGDVSPSCTFENAVNGVLAINGTRTTMGTTNSGGSAATINAITTDATYSLFVTGVSAWEAGFPVGGDTNVTFETTFAGTGATTIASTIAAPAITSAALAQGDTAITVDLVGTKAGIFPAGNYDAKIVITCTS